MAESMSWWTKYESSDSSNPMNEAVPTAFLLKQSDEFARSYYMLKQSYIGGDWLTSLKFLSHLMKHLNDMDSCSTARSSTCQSANPLPLFPDRSQINVRANCQRNASGPHSSQLLQQHESSKYCAQYVASFKTEFSAFVTEIIFHVQKNDCLHQYLINDVQELIGSIKAAYSSDIDVLLSLSHLLFSLDFKDEALQDTYEIIKACPESAKAQETFENICCYVIDRWHFKMLNDVSRNRAYEHAISDVMQHYIGGKKTVCDIGSGTGLLSFISAKNADHVYAIEKSPMMCHIATNVMKADNFDSELADKIQMINKMSTDLKVPQNFSSRADILVTETFDAGLFGEGIISTLSHAWRELLVSTVLQSEGMSKISTVIPKKAKIYVEAISSHDISEENSFHHNGSWCGLKLESLAIQSVVAMVQSDPYSSCHLRDLARGYKLLSDACLLMEVDFNNPEEIFHLEKGVHDILQFDMKDDGSLDALIVWFQLFLTDSICLSTQPGSERCWEQAVFPVRNGCVTNSQVKGPLTVSKGDKVSLQYCVEEDRLSLHNVHVLGKGICSDKENTAYMPSSTCVQKLKTDASEWWSSNTFCLREWEILSLNNQVYHEKLLQHANNWRNIHRTSSISVIDTHPGFSFVALQLLSDGCQAVYLMTQQDSQKALTCKVAQINHLDVRKVNFYGDVSELMDFDFLNSVENTAESSSLSKAAIALCEIVDYNGQLAENLESQFEYLRYALSNFSVKEVLPQKVDVYGLFIESDRLRSDSLIVCDENTLSFPIGHILNEFSITNHPGITLSTHPHKKLTEAFKIVTLDFLSFINTTESEHESDSHDSRNVKQRDLSMSESGKEPNVTGHSRSGTLEQSLNTDKPQTLASNRDIESVTAISDNFVSSEQFVQGTSNSNLHMDGEMSNDSCFDQTVDLVVPVTEAGRLSAMVYWFDIHLSPTQHINTAAPSLHWKQAAVMLNNDVVFKGKKLSVSIRLQNSNLNVKLKRVAYKQENIT